MTEIRILSAKDVAACLTMDEVIDAVRVANPHNPERARAFVETLPGKLAGQFGIERVGVRFEAVDDLEAAVEASGIVVTATMATSPLIEAAWVRPGTHLSCMGAEDVTVFDSAGTALLDIACAKIALDAAAGRGLGTVAEL